MNPNVKFPAEAIHSREITLGDCYMIATSDKGLATSGQALVLTGGAAGNRTPDLYNAIVALSQLSYGPGLPPLKGAAAQPCGRLERRLEIRKRTGRAQGKSATHSGSSVPDPKYVAYRIQNVGLRYLLYRRPWSRPRLRHRRPRPVPRRPRSAR